MKQEVIKENRHQEPATIAANFAGTKPDTCKTQESLFRHHISAILVTTKQDISGRYHFQVPWHTLM